MTGFLHAWLQARIEDARLAGTPAIAEAYERTLRHVQGNGINLYIGPQLTPERAQELIDQLHAAFPPAVPACMADEPVITAEGDADDLDAALRSTAGRLWLAYRARETCARGAAVRPFPIISDIDCMRRAMVATGVR